MCYECYEKCVKHSKQIFLKKSFFLTESDKFMNTNIPPNLHKNIN